MSTATPDRVSSLAASELPVLSREQLAELHFGEGCQLEEYLFLRGLALMLQPERILEVGTSCGVGGLMLLDGACAFGRQAQLTTIDVKRHEAFDRNLSQFPHLAGRIERIVASSDAALPDLRRQGCRFDLVFVDGDHSAEQSLRDWRGVEPLADRFILHDTDQMAGCRALVTHIRQDGGFDTLSFTYPLGHQLFHGARGAGRVYDGLYHQTQLAWTSGSAGPGLTLVQRQARDGL